MISEILHADSIVVAESAIGESQAASLLPATSGHKSCGVQKLSDDDELAVWLETLPRKVRFMLAMSVSALSLQRGQCRSRDDLRCFLAAAGLPISRQAIENIECRALRKCRETELAIIAKEHLTTR